MPYRMQHISFASTNALEQGPVHPWYSSTYLNSQTLPIIAPNLALGGIWELEGEFKNGGGNAFMLVKNNASSPLALGDVVSWATPTADTAAAGSTAAVINLTTGGLTAGAEVGNLVYCQPTGGTPWLRVIKANTANSLTISKTDYTIATKPFDPDALATADIPTATDPVVIYRPYQVQKATSTTPAVGVSLGTVTANYYTIIQVAGVGLIKSTNSGAALAVNVPAIGSGTAGVLTGGGGTANAYYGTRFIPLVAYNAAGPTLQPYNFNCIGNI